MPKERERTKMIRMSNKEPGLRCGIEIHQQLEGKKLFCSCSTLIREEEPDFTIKRKLRAVAGERGEVDVTAREEQLKDKGFVYQGYKDSTCLVETDSEPPHELNKEALYTCLQFCKMVGAKVSSVIQVMRKTVVDGSNTSGFQRTALIARGGKIKTSEGSVRIENISLEEDAARIISESGKERVYRLDRLGIPLIEIGTAPDIKTAEQGQETAKQIGMLLRSLPGVKRGLGTIRQDLNVSVEGGSRVEIKGAQELRALALLIDLEKKRQIELLRIKEELAGVKLKELKIYELTNLLRSSSAKILEKAGKERGKILGIKLEGFEGFLGRELQPGYRLGTELAGRAKALAGVGGIFHSDELPGYGIMEKEVEAIKKELKIKEKEAFVVVAEKEEKARKALEAVYARAKEVLGGVPKEVRKANPEGTTSYLRQMPGGARMYPETDVGLVRPRAAGEVEVPERLEEKSKRYQEKLELGKDLAEFVARSDKALLFEELTARYPEIKPAFIGETLTSTLLGLKRESGVEPEKITEEHFRDLFRYLTEGKIHKDIVISVLIEMAKGTFDIKKYEGLSTEELHKELRKIVEENKGAPFSALMGRAMEKLRGKGGGKVIAEELKKMVEKGHK